MEVRSCATSVLPLTGVTSRGPSFALATPSWQRVCGLWAMYSSDGIRWQEYSGQPNPFDQWCDTQNVFFWDDRLEQYVGYTRVRETQVAEEAAAAGGGTYRSIGRITSHDFRSWSKTQIVLEADADDLAIPVPYQREGPRLSRCLGTVWLTPWLWWETLRASP